MRIPAILLASALALPWAAQAENPPTHHRLPPPAGTARLVLPGEGIGPVPLVILLPDSLGEQGRSDAYVDALAARGLASLVLGLDGDPEAKGPARDPAASAEAVRVARDWAAQQGPLFDATAVIGVGAGARAALEAGGGPVVALDPGCLGLQLPAWTPVLVVHGRAAADAAACAALEEPPAAVILGLPEAGHGWDVAPALGLGAVQLPDAAGEGVWLARINPVLTGVVAETIAAWLDLQFAARGARR